MTLTVAEIENYRSTALASINEMADALLAQVMSSAPVARVNIPTLEQAQDPRNKNGVNLTPRGVEIIYRLFDDNAGYNRASKALGIAQTAARARKGQWEKLGGLNRIRQPLDIDE